MIHLQTKETREIWWASIKLWKSLGLTFSSNKQLFSDGYYSRPCTCCSSDTRRTFQSRLTWCLCSPPSVGTTPSVRCTRPASTGSASTPARSLTPAPPTPSAGLTTTSLSARVPLDISETRESSALSQNVSYSSNFDLVIFCTIQENLFCTIRCQKKCTI